MTETASLTKTAERLRVSQSTLTRQIQALEHELGGRLFERSPTGVALTAAGHALYDSLKTLLPQIDAALGGVRRLARGQSGSLRIGYLMSTAADYLNPALAIVRTRHPEVKVKLVDLSPGEQIAALRRGELDVALVGDVGKSLARDFYVKRLVSLPVAVALPEEHPLASHEALKLADLRGEVFVGAKEEDLPGYNQWIVGLCRRARFRPRFVEDAESLPHAFSLLVAENAVTLLPDLKTKPVASGVTSRPLDERSARWDLNVAWQRGQMTQPMRALVDALSRHVPTTQLRAKAR